MIKFYTIKEAAPILNVSEITLKRWLLAGKVKGQKIGRKWAISEDNLKAFINAGASHENS